MSGFISRSERPPPVHPRRLDLLAQPERPLYCHEATQDWLQRLALVATVLLKALEPVG
jgi:hypothetical protein